MPAIATVLACLVIGIADGDTLTVRCDAQAEQAAQTVIIRLAEIDAPEKHQPFGARSKQALAAMCSQKPAIVKPQTRDRYGRSVARIDCDGTDTNVMMIRNCRPEWGNCEQEGGGE